MNLTTEEMEWLLELVNIIKCQGIKTELVFCTTGGGMVKNIGKRIANEWFLLRLLGRPTFNLIRSSTSTKVNVSNQARLTDNS